MATNRKRPFEETKPSSKQPIKKKAQFIKDGFFSPKENGSPTTRKSILKHTNEGFNSLLEPIDDPIPLKPESEFNNLISTLIKNLNESENDKKKAKITKNLSARAIFDIAETHFYHLDSEKITGTEKEQLVILTQNLFEQAAGFYKSSNPFLRSQMIDYLVPLHKKFDAFLTGNNASQKSPDRIAEFQKAFKHADSTSLQKTMYSYFLTLSLFCPQSYKTLLGDVVKNLKLNVIKPEEFKAPFEAENDRTMTP